MTRVRRMVRRRVEAALYARARKQPREHEVDADAAPPSPAIREEPEPAGVAEAS